ncbi:hypothetical protein BC826DRAFT_973785 [Russula brevipes]|nr:hypothetical protein BC826DRAFT_973785 [Russula brevipes]
MARIVSRKRARSSDTATTSTAPPEDVPASASWAIQNPALQLPTELIYTILAISVGDYVGDLMLHPSRIHPQDVILTSLHVSRTFRGCTVKLLSHLWGDTFILEKTRHVYLRVSSALTLSIPLTELHSIIGNYKPTHSIFRQLSRQARSAPHSFTSRDSPPKHLSARVVRHPISPLARICRQCRTLDTETGWRCVEFDDVYAAKDLQLIMDSYAEIPAGVRDLLLGRVMHWVRTEAAIWTKLKALNSTVTSVFRLLLLLVEAGGKIEIRGELPKITEDSVVQVSRDKHENLADTFSLSVEDIPPVHRRHSNVVGLHMVLSMLEYVEGKGSAYVELCQMMRSYIVSHLTDEERAEVLEAQPS